MPRPSASGPHGNGRLARRAERNSAARSKPERTVFGVCRKNFINDSQALTAHHAHGRGRYCQAAIRILDAMAEARTKGAKRVMLTRVTSSLPVIRDVTEIDFHNPPFSGLTLLSLGRRCFWNKPNPQDATIGKAFGGAARANPVSAPG